MSHGGDHRDLRGVDGPGHPLVIEGPQVLHGPAAPAGDEHVAQLPAVGVPDGAHDLRWGLRPLDPHRQQQHLGDGIAPAQNADHIVDRRPGAAGNDGDALGVQRQRLLVSRVKQPLLLELLLQLLKGHIQVPYPVRRQLGAVQLICTVPGKHADPAEYHGLHAVFRPEPQLHGAGLEHDAPQGALSVLQGEVVVAGGIDLVVGQLAPDVKSGELRRAVDQVLDKTVDLGHGKNMLLIQWGRSSFQASKQRQSVAALPAVGHSFTSARRKLPRMPLMNFTTSGDS